MSLIGDTHAFIGLGISCQTAKQLSIHAEFLSQLIGENLAPQSSFLNWVCVGASDIGNIVNRLISGPITAEAITVPSTPGAALRLEDYKLWFWHEKRSHLATSREVALIAEKYEHLRKNFLRMLDKPNRHLILGNAQNNISEHDPYLNGEMDIMLDRQIVAALADADWTRNRWGQADILTISRQGRWQGDKHNSTVLVDKDKSEWSGNQKGWRDALTEHFAGRGNQSP